MVRKFEGTKREMGLHHEDREKIASDSGTGKQQLKLLGQFLTQIIVSETILSVARMLLQIRGLALI
jgi:hypothetical protein